MPIPIEQSPRVADAEAEAEEIVTPQPQPQAPPPPPEPQSDPRTLESDTPETWNEFRRSMVAKMMLLEAKCERMHTEHILQASELMELKSAILGGKLEVKGESRTVVLTAQVLHVKNLPSAD